MGSDLLSTSYFARRVLVLGGLVLAGRLLVSLPVISVPAVGIVTPIAGCESASATAIDVYPAFIFADLTVPWIRLTLTSLVVEVVVITIDPQSLPELGYLLPARVWIRGEISGSTASCSNAHASGSTDSKLRLVVVSAFTVPPFRPTAIAELCFAATTAVL